MYINGGLYVAQPADEVAPPVQRTAVHSFADRPVPPDWFLPLVEQEFGDDANGEVLRMYAEAIKHGKVVAHPIWEFVAERTTRGRVVMLGDCAHTVTPNTARGAHTALLDAQALRGELL